ncbi:hypothetical protein [Cecembia sp.]|uniref:hypothetical protein n=1 Tax=Cecembia sp. TaxID=1898110 RepID=UPI0025BCB021|nr:hypothetical protein [Cecembia sp.]
MRSTVARFFTVLGHPLILGTLYVVLMAQASLPPKTALLVSLLVLGLVALPITVHNLLKFKKGEYSNFDVSDQKQRKGFYPFALGLFLILLLLFFVFEFPTRVIYNTGNFFLMLLLMAFLNIKLKASLHAAVAFYAGTSIFGISSILGMLFIILAFGTSWSRLVLKKHNQMELFIGSLMGLFFGIISLTLI